jgi:HAD superfamily hydrolase (TIGR01509 family)
VFTEAIFWDNDGVLVDTERLYLEATRQVLASVGVPLTDSQYMELFLVQGIGAWHLVEAKGFSRSDIEQLRETRNTLYAQRLAQASMVIDGVPDVLEALHGRCHMGVVTSSRKDHFELIHQRTGLLKYFDFVLTSEDFARVKPDPEPYLKAIERSGCAPERCLAIEDSERGLASAKSAGIRCIVVPTSLTRHSSFEGAHRVLGSVGEILSVV